jgi:hypothetical protein
MDGATPPPAGTIPSGKSPVTIVIHGSGLRPDMTVQWTAANQEPVKLEPSAVQLVSETTLKVTLVPGGPGPGRLMLMTRGGLTEPASLTVTP